MKSGTEVDGELIEVVQEPEPKKQWPGLSPGHATTAEQKAVLRLFKDRSLVAANILYDLMTNRATADSLRATIAMHHLDRAFGKPKQSIEVEDRGRTLEEMLQAMWAAKAIAETSEPE